MEKKNRELNEEFVTRAHLSRALYIEICKLSAGGATLRTEIIKLRNDLKSRLENSPLRLYLQAGSSPSSERINSCLCFNAFSASVRVPNSFTAS